MSNLVAARSLLPDHGHHHGPGADHTHDGPGHAVAPTEPSRAVVIAVDEDHGALVLSSSAERAGLEVQIHPVSNSSKRTHVWVLPREGREGVVYAAIFPRLATDDYSVLAPDGSVALTIPVLANRVTHAEWA
jgi:hypothetical protein